MAFATSAIVGGQALAVAVTGRLAESHSPVAAFAATSVTAALAYVIALAARRRRAAERSFTRAWRTAPATRCPSKGLPGG